GGAGQSSLGDKPCLGDASDAPQGAKSVAAGRLHWLGPHRPKSAAPFAANRLLSVVPGVDALRPADSALADAVTAEARSRRAFTAPRLLAFTASVRALGKSG